MKNTSLRKRVKKNRKTLVLDGENLKIDDLEKIISNEKLAVSISAKARRSIIKSFDFLCSELNDKITYGVNTGFGPMASHVMGRSELTQLQRNLIVSHAVGIGEPIAQKYVLAAMIVRLNTLARGHSGVSEELIDRLTLLINKRIIPVIPDHGAVGTSGDLTQLAHIALAIIGEGEAFYKDERMPVKAIFKELNIKPYKLKQKEGLSLINGTSVMSGISSVLCVDAKRLVSIAIRNAGLALELLESFSDSLSPHLHKTRPHYGQIKIAELLRELTSDSKLLKTRSSLHKKFKVSQTGKSIPASVQEVYSLRCTPQILGPILDTLLNTIHHVEIEINSTTDNPVLDVDNKLFLHGGNFHGDYIASVIDQLKIALVKLTILSERRINFFMNDDVNKKFPPFVNLEKPGLTLGLQGLQFVATSTTARNQTLAFPQYVHSIPTNKDNQDVVSMGTDAALITSQVVDNAYVVQSIEMITLAQVADFTNMIKSMGGESRRFFRKIREFFPKVTKDRVLVKELEAVLAFAKKLPSLGIKF